MMFEGRSWSGHERNVCLLNLRQGKFVDISACSGFDFADDGRALAPVDWDGDGDLDLLTTNRNAPRLRLLRNTHGGNFLALTLQGDGKSANRDAIGARVELWLTPTNPSEVRQPIIRTVRAGESFLTCSTKTLHFGLGTSKWPIEKLVVRWPAAGSDQMQVFTNVSANKHYRLKQGEELEALLPRDQSTLTLVPQPNKLPESSSKVRVPALVQFHAPQLTFEDWQSKQRRTLKPDHKSWVLVNLWATWCAPCIKELKEFATRADELDRAGIQVLALSVDGLGSAEKTARTRNDHAVRAVLKRLDFPFPAGIADKRLVLGFQHIDDFLTALRQPLPVPCSFLLTPDHQVAAVYKGPVQVDQVIADAESADSDFHERWLQAAPLGGKAIEHPRVRSIAAALQSTHHYRRARALEADFPKQAIKHYLQALRLRDDFSRARTAMAKTFLSEGERERAERELRYVIDHDPEFPNASFELLMLDLQAGRVVQAVSQMQELLQKHPDHAATQNNLAWFQATSPGKAWYDPEGAVRLAEQANAATNRELPDYLDTLAVAYASVRRFDDAVETMKEAIAVAEALKSDGLLPDLRKRLNDFRRQRPYLP